jgi:hypothetical protein
MGEDSSGPYGVVNLFRDPRTYHVPKGGFRSQTMYSASDLVINLHFMHFMQC